MFAIKLRHIYLVCVRTTVRNLRNRRLDPLAPNPGINKRIEAFNKEGIPVIDDDAEEFVEDSASDMFKAGELYNKHVAENLMGKLELRHQIVKQKYFKENMPNLLTWSEKEQIRHLANTDPDEWTPEKIAESFPVTVPIVKKLLKYPWKPASENRISRHDQSAMRNWKELKEGTLDIPEDMRKHFLKFSNRTIPPLNKKTNKTDLTQQSQDLGEFESIIRKCANTQNPHTDNKSNASDTENEDTTDSSKERKYSKRVTLEELKTKIKKRLDSGQDVDMPDQFIVNTSSISSPENNVSDESSEIELHTGGESNDLTVFDKEEKEVNIMDYPERIRIPKKAYKKSATYKVNDCYYDHDGKFLYRVLGMTGMSK